MHQFKKFIMGYFLFFYHVMVALDFVKTAMHLGFQCCA